MSDKPIAPVIEIVERRREAPKDDSFDSVIVPTDVRINGQSLLVSDDGVTVHEIDTADRDVVRVTVTFIARRVVIDSEVE